ncbi:hypothetical protein ERHA55_27720 [Erwinia rhapontici]|nr:hypothetical protein ERHA55_27720 [Erwinia rhapontici]
MKVRALCSLMPLLMAGPLYAEETADSGGDMVVSASRTASEKKDSPQVITIITQQQIEQQRQITSDTSQILSNLLPSFSPAVRK